MKFFLLSIFLQLSFLSMAFDLDKGPFKITGHVHSADGEPLPGASIRLNENLIAVTDNNGDFRLDGVKAGNHLLSFSYIGFDSVKIKVSLINKDIHLDVKMNEKSEQLDEVIVLGDHYKTGRVEQSIVSISVDESFIRSQNSGALINSIEKIPGINSINTGVGIAKPVIRGMSFNRVIVLDKGIKQEGQQWGADHGLEIDQYDAEHLEIIKGPSSLLYGSDGIGGVIRILPPEIPNDDNKVSGEAFLTYKSNNDLFGGSVKAEGKKGNYFFRGRVSGQSFADYGVPASNFFYNSYVLDIYNERLKNTAGREVNFSLTGGVEKNNYISSVTVSSFNQKAGLFSGATGIPREYQMFHDGSYRNIDLPRQRTNHHKVLSNSIFYFEDNWLTIDAGYQFNNRKEEGEPHAHGYQPTPDGNLALGLQLHTLSVNAAFNHTLSDKIQNTYGFQAQYQHNTHDGFEFLLPNYTAKQIGFYTYSEYTANKSLTLNAGLRYDWGDRDIEKHIEPDYTTFEEGDSIVRNGDIYRKFNNISAAVGLSWYPNKYINVKSNLGTSFRMPSVAELASNGVHHGTFRHEKGDSTLNSERGIQLDLNFTYTKKQFYLSVSPYLGYFYNYIYISPQIKFSPLPSGGQLYQYRQNDALFCGFEYTSEWNITKKLLFRNSLEYVWNKNIDRFRPLPLTPPFSVLGEVEYDFNTKNKKQQYSATITYQYFAAQNRVDTNEKKTPGYGLLRANLNFKIPINQKIVNLNLTVDNLLNTKYMNHLSRYRLLNLVEKGRNIIISVQIPL
jgi:iron complex outermembrane receptor protein